MELDLPKTIAAFALIIALGVVGMLATPMTLETVLMMVLPSMVIFGAIVLAIGVKHGEYRASR